jgi:hypothetical protein
MIENHPKFSIAEMRLLFRLIPAEEREVALNLRSHNPVDVKMVTEVQTYVDQALGIKGSTFFRSGDDMRVAALKGIRNILASRVKKRWVSRWFFREMDSQGLDSLSVYLYGLYASPKVRWLTAAGAPKFLVLVFCLLAKRLKHQAEVVKGMVFQCRDLLTKGLVSGGGQPREETALNRVEARPATVLVLTSLYHQIVNFTVKRVVDELEQRKTNVILAFHSGFVSPKPRSTENGSWWSHKTWVALESGRGALSSWTVRLVTPRLLFSTTGSIAFAFKRILRAPSGDWGARWMLLREAPVLIAGFHVRLSQAQSLLSRLHPSSVFNCDNGSENNLYVKAFAYACLRNKFRFYRYKPVPAFPVRQPVFNSVSRFMLATPDDTGIFRDNGAVPEFWHVGSPILDLAAPFVLKKTSKTPAPDAENPDKIRILFFAKRDFPNQGVISAISQSCVRNSRPAELTVKFHPSDSRQFASDRVEPTDIVKIVYYGKEEIEQVDRLIFEADIVISGSSNVIWSAFAQFKPVVYLGFKGMSSEGHVSGYGRYATSEFIAASELKEVGDIVGRLIDKILKGEASKHFDRHDLLMRNFFCSGEFNSKERICRVLVGPA